MTSDLPRAGANNAAISFQVTEYDLLSNDEHLTLLEALMWCVADSDIFREHLQDDGPDTLNDLLPRGEAMGADDSGACYYRLGSRTGDSLAFGLCPKP